MTNSFDAPLTGVRVLDLSTVVAGPFGSEILASLGAEVIRVEPAPGLVGATGGPGDPISDDEGFWFALQRNKSSVTLDLKSAAGHADFLRLVATADVVYDNFRPGVLTRLGIDHAALAQVRPDIISCSISGFGARGPWAGVAAYDVAVQALGGSMSITGTGAPGSMPCRWGVPIGDLAGSFYAVTGVLAALRERDATGRGQAVEVSLLDGQLALNTYRVPQVFGAGMEFDVPSPRKGGAGTVPYGPFLCGDGRWLVIGIASNFWRPFCGTLADPSIVDDPRFRTLADRQAHQAALEPLLEAEFLAASAAEWQRRLVAAGVPVGKVNTIQEAFALDQAQARNMAVVLPDASGRSITVAGSPIRFAGEPPAPQHLPRATGSDTDRLLREVPPPKPAAPPRRRPTADLVAQMAAQTGPLAGTLVLELCGDEPSGTFGTQILADLGATVVKIERPPAGAVQPGVVQPDGLVPEGIAYFFGLNRNKRSLCLDLKTPAARAVFLQLAALADVVYDNYKPGVTDRLGVGPAALQAVNPGIITCSVSGFGKTGPWRDLPAYDATIQALGGGMSLTGTGEAGSPPVRWGNPVGGIGGAFYAVIGILAALHRHRRSGRGAEIDIALLDTQLAMHGYRVPPAHSGRVYGAEQRRGGSGALPYGPFLARDGRWFVLGITGQFWKTAARVLGHPEWAEDPRFITQEDRQRNEAALNPLVAQAMLAEDAATWQQRFVDAGIPGAVMRTIPEAFDHPHVGLRHMLVGFDDPAFGDLRVAGNPVKLSAHPFRGFRPAPALGGDGAEVLGRLAGIAPATLADLRAAKALWWSETAAIWQRPSVV